MRLVEVVWIDAVNEDGHLPLEAIQGMASLERRNVGYLVRLGDNVVITWGIIHNYYKNLDAYDGAMVIPKQMVKEIKYLKGEKDDKE